MPFQPSPKFVSVVPADPAAITSATYLHAGLGVAGATAFTLTPQVTGRVFIHVVGNMLQSNTATTGTVQLRYGTGAAPANAAAPAGTAAGAEVTNVGLTGKLQAPFALSVVITGLAVPTINSQGVQAAAVPVWFDVAIKSSANSCQILALCCTAIEI